VSVTQQLNLVYSYYVQVNFRITHISQSYISSTARQSVAGQSFVVFLTHFFRHNTLGTHPLDKRSTWWRDIYLTTHNTHKRQISVSPAGFETEIPASERPQAHALDRAATGIGLKAT